MAVVDTRVLTGARFNLLESGTVTVSSTVSTEDPLFPRTNLYDGRPSRPFRMLTSAALTSIGGISICDVTVDGNQVLNGNFDVWSAGTPVSWTENDTGTAAVTETTTVGEVVTGSAAKLAAGTGNAYLWQDIVVRSGQKRRIEFFARADAGGLDVLLQNLATGNGWNGSAWVAGAATPVAIGTVATMTAFGANYTVEPFSTTQTDLCTLRILIAATGTKTGFVDDLYDFPAVDVMTMHGHNLEPGGFLCVLRSDTAAFAGAGTLEATAVVAQPAFYVLLAAAVYRRYWRVRVTGSWWQTLICEIGELVIGQAYSLLQGATYGAELGFLRDDVATETGLGEQHVYARTRQARRTLGLKFRFDSETKYRAARDEMFKRSGGRVNPLVIIPDTTLPDVIYGRIDRSWKVTRSLVAYYDQNDLTVVESAFPIATN